MSETISLENAAARRAAARVPPWPPREPANGGDGSRYAVVVFHESSDSNEDGDRQLAVVKFDPRRSQNAHEILSPRNLPSLVATISYSAETEAVQVIVLREERDLITLSSPGPADTYIAVRLSHETTLSIFVHRNFKV